MTGFGVGEFEVNGIKSKVEIKSINNRYCDIKVKMPLQSLDILQRIENIIQQKISRGSINVLIKTEISSEKITNIKLNEELLQSYLKSFQRLKEITQIDEKITLDSLLRYKEIFEFVKEDEGEDLWESIKISLETAMEKLAESREIEGDKLIKDILKRLDKMKVIILEIEKNKNQYLQNYQEKLEEKIFQIGQNISLEQGRVEMEVSILAQKSDITEEIIRLKSHLSQLKKIAKNVNPIGRKIEFYVQEVGREINTIGAKTNDKIISSRVIKLKEELEKIKEQARNIE